MSTGLGEPLDEAAAAIVEAAASRRFMSITRPVVEILAGRDEQLRETLLRELLATQADLSTGGPGGERRQSQARDRWADLIRGLRDQGRVNERDVREVAGSVRDGLREDQEGYPTEHEYDTRRGLSRDWGPPAAAAPPADLPPAAYESPPGTTFGDDDDEYA